jgi:threonine dehydratase
VIPAFAAVRDAAARIAPFVHRTPVITSAALDAWLGCRAFCKGEHLQRAGAFKYRGATNAVQLLPGEQAARGVAAHSSGNHAAALARAAATRGIPAYVVMPHDAPAIKREAVAGYGARITWCDNTPEARAEALHEVLEETGATEIHPYDHPDVIAGAGTAALELLEDVTDLEAIVAPVGGGGLLSGTAIAAHGMRPGLVVAGAEPEHADDAARSLATGRLRPPQPPATIADGLLTGLSERTFAILRQHVTTIVTVEEDEIRAAMRFVWERTKQVVEPSAAVAVAGVRRAARGEHRGCDLAGARVGIVLSGGNTAFPD